MYLTAYEDVIIALNKVNEENYSNFFMLAVNAGPIQKMYAQRLLRKINGVEQEFLAIRDVVIDNECRKQGIFSGLLNQLDSKNIPILIDDIINDQLDNYLMKKGYHPLSYEKNGFMIRARYRLKKPYF